MGARLAVVIGVLVLSAGVASAQRSTLQPSKLSLFVPSGWQVVRDNRAGDTLHWETASDGGRSFDIKLERITTKCKAWKADAATKQLYPAYWPTKARTGLFTLRTADAFKATGCLADVTGGGLLVRLDITVEDPKYKPSKDDSAALKDALAAVLAGSEDLPPLTSTTTTTTTSTTTTTTTTGVGDTSGPRRPPDPIGENPFENPPVKGGSTATVPRVDIAVRLPKSASWTVGARGEAIIQRRDAGHPLLTAKLFALTSRTCNEWRVDTSTNQMATYETKAAYLPAAVKTGAFRWMSGGMQVALCVPTKVGTLGISIEYADEPAKDELAVIRQLIEGIAVGAAKHSALMVAAPTVLEGGTQADASIGSISLPKGAQWRVENGTVERFDKGKYFSVSSMTRATACAATDAKERAYLPTGIKGTVQTRTWGTTVVTACFGTTRTIELTIAYDGAIATADHALIKSLVDAFVSSTKKTGPKS